MQYTLGYGAVQAAPYAWQRPLWLVPGCVLLQATLLQQLHQKGQLVWNTKSLHQILQFDLPHGQGQQCFTPSCLSISPDEKWLLVGCQCPALLLLYSLPQRKLQHALKLPEEMWTVVQAQLLPDSNSAAGVFSNLQVPTWQHCPPQINTCKA